MPHIDGARNIFFAWILTKISQKIHGFDNVLFKTKSKGCLLTILQVYNEFPCSSNQALLISMKIFQFFFVESCGYEVDKDPFVDMPF